MSMLDVLRSFARDHRGSQGITLSRAEVQELLDLFPGQSKPSVIIEDFRNQIAKVILADHEKQYGITKAIWEEESDWRRHSIEAFKNDPHTKIAAVIRFLDWREEELQSANAKSPAPSSTTEESANIKGTNP